MYYVYVLKIKRDKWYIGYTNNLERRVKQHKEKYKCKLKYYESYTSSKQARDRERRLKHYGSAWRALRDRITA